MPSPSFTFPVLGKTVPSTYPTPLVADTVLLVPHQTTNPDYATQSYGTAHPDTTLFSGYKLALIVLSEDKQTASWYYVADRHSQRAYNYAINFSAESAAHPIYQRSYIIPRLTFTPEARGTADPVAAGTTQLVEEHVLETTGAPELESLYVKVVRVYESLPGPELHTTVLGSLELIPAKFRASTAMTVKMQTVAAGTSPDALSSTVFQSQVKDETANKATREVYSLTPNSDPLLGQLVTQQQQLGTISETLVDTSGASLSISALTVDGQLENLGNGKSVKRVVTVGSLFDEGVAEVSRIDNLPPDFRFDVGETTVSTVVAATSISTPSMSTGDVVAANERVTAQKVRQRRTTLATSFPRTLTGSKMSGEFGGGVLQVERKLSDSALGAESGLLVVASEDSPIGTGLFVRETAKLVEAEAWPILYGTNVDENTGIVFHYSKQVVAAGTTGGTSSGTIGGITGPIYSEVQPIDKWRSLKISTLVDPDSLPESVSYPVTIEERDPNTYTNSIVSATSGYLYDEANQGTCTAGSTGPRLATATEYYLMADDLTAFIAALPTERRMVSGSYNTHTNSYAVTSLDDHMYAKVFSSEFRVDDSRTGTLASLTGETLRFGIIRLRTITIP